MGILEFILAMTMTLMGGFILLVYIWLDNYPTELYNENKKLKELLSKQEYKNLGGNE